MSELIQKLSQLIAEDLQAAPNATVEELVERLKADDRIIQINSGNALAFQTVVEGGTANVGIHLHDFDEEKLDRVLQAFWKSLQSSEVPNNVPRSGVAKFIGREPELERLHVQLQQGNLVSISAVEGMGGVGKTELAIQYTRRYASAYEGSIAWLFAREFNMGTQVVGFAQSQLNLKIPEGLELPDQVAFCWRNWREGDVLLVLDDVANYSRDVEPYLPPPASSRFKIIMTTRLTFGPPIQSLSLNVLSPEHSLELLTVLIGDARVQPELEIAQSLCKWLEHLPLGIELVGRYLLKRTDLSLSTLLFRLQEKAKKRQAIKHDALQRDEVMGTSTARRGAEAAFELSWDELNESSQHLGKLLSLFAAAPIPWHLVEAVERRYCENSEGGQEFDVETFEDTRARLLALHLLQLSEEQEQVYRLHSLIREFFGSKLEDKNPNEGEHARVD
jgi:NB-ARC domain